MTRRLYYDDAYLKQFDARIVERGGDPCEVYLDQTAFYPTSGGQPHDTGTIAGVQVTGVLEDGDRIQHRLARPVGTTEVSCAIDWPRRFDHMQQHSGQHLLSAVFVRLFGAQTIGFHLSAEISTIDLDITSLTPEQLREAEQQANDLIFENRPLSVTYEEASEAAGLRKQSDRQGVLRIVTIEGVDRSACGGTHVHSTGEIGCLLLRGLDKVRGKPRVEFVCGGRAVRRARADFDLLTGTARVLSSQIEETPALVAAMRERLAGAEKTGKRLRRELAQWKGAALYRETAPDERGVRRVVRRGTVAGSPDELRAEAQSFTANPVAVFIAAGTEPPSVLVAASPDSGIHAGDLLKKVLQEVGGRGGGNARIAQGSLPSPEAVEEVLRRLAPDS